MNAFGHRLCGAFLACWLAGLLPAAAAARQPASAPHGPAIPAEVRAADDAFHNLVDKVLSLRLEDGRLRIAEVLLPRNAAGGLSQPVDPTAERALRLALLNDYQRGAPRPTAGGGVEVDAWLSTARLNDMLRDIAAVHLPRLNRARLVLGPGAGPTVTATGWYVPDGRPRDDRPGWRHCPPEQIVQTRDAARFDVRQRLLDRIGSMRLQNDELLRAVLTRFPAFRDALIRQVETVPLRDPIFEPTGVCQLRLTITRADVLALVQAAAARSREPELPAGLADLTDPRRDDPIVIDGFAVPPPYTPPPTRTRLLAEPDRPEWADRTLSQKGTGAPPPGAQGEQARRDLALKAARMDAARLLWLDIEKLPLGTGTVGDILAGQPRSREIAAEIDKLMVPMSSPAFDDQGQATVALGLRLEPLWRIVRDLR